MQPWALQILAPLAFLMTAATHAPNALPVPALPFKTQSACTVVTKAEIEAALGRAVSNGVEHKGADQSSCDYTGGDGQITVALVHSNDKLEPEAEIAELKKLLPPGALRETTGIGTQAYFVDIPHAGAQLHVFRGEHDYLMVSVLGFGAPAAASEAAMLIARKALDRL
jgi:hypothetical protein